MCGLGTQTDDEDNCFDGAVFELYLSDVHINNEKRCRAVFQGVGDFNKFSFSPQGKLWMLHP